MKKGIRTVLALAILVGAAGCESLPKKFIRKKPKPAHTATVMHLEQGPYQKKFSNEYYYKMHFTLWKTWQDEILDNLNGNSKKVRRSAEEAYSHLEQMNRYLKPEKQAELAPLLEESKRIMDKLETSNVSRSDAANLRTDLERVMRRVSGDFYYEKVKDGVLSDSVDLGG